MIERDVSRLSLERIDLSSVTTIDKCLLVSAHNVRLIQRDAVERMEYRLVAHLYGLADERIDIDRQWPADWWQAVKERWAPAWAKRRWPVRYEKVSIHRAVYAAVCGHIEADQKPHFEFLFAQSRHDHRRTFP